MKSLENDETAAHTHIACTFGNMEWVFREIDPKSADPNQYKGAPNPFERTCTANLFAVNVKKYPHAGAAFPPQQNGIPLRSGWAADGVVSREHLGPAKPLTCLTPDALVLHCAVLAREPWMVQGCSPFARGPSDQICEIRVAAPPIRSPVCLKGARTRGITSLAQTSYCGYHGCVCDV